jgi:S-DNA-T family DNA segregation ATPase FtsK/SpoIIIE
MPKDRFDAAKDALQSGLQVYVDEIKEDRKGGTIDVIYSHDPMPSLTKIEDIRSVGKDKIIIGMARAKTVTTSLSDVPHFLIAGETGGGKSTFLRQVIASLYINNEDMDFTLVDLKGGLEFTSFADLKGVSVVTSLDAAVPALVGLEDKLSKRIEVYRGQGVKDIEAFRSKLRKGAKAEGKSDAHAHSRRHLLVIDEVAELFLAGTRARAQDVQAARAASSRLARQGRAVGIHLILGTQRPDVRALDSQIKGNIPGRVCFQMPDHASSMVVLGNTRARELPGVAGRAIWQRGLEMVEVQTPFLSPEEVETLLKSSRTCTPKTEGKPQELKPPFALAPRETRHQGPH